MANAQLAVTSGGLKTDYGIAIGAVHLVSGFEVKDVEIARVMKSGLLIGNARFGTVIGNDINANGWWGVDENSPADNNIYLGNRLVGNTLGPIKLAGANSEAIRNVAAAGALIADTGGFRQTIDGWTISSNAASDTKLARFGVAEAVGMRFRAARSGSVTGLVVTSTEPWETGELTVTVYKNSTGDADADGSSMDFSATLEEEFPSTHAVIQAKDVPMSQFGAGDELYLVMTKSDWTPTDALIRCAIEIEN